MLVYSILAAATAPLLALAQSATSNSTNGSNLMITSPSASKWLIDNSQATFKWTGDTPTTFVVYIHRDGLASDQAIVGLTQTYEHSHLIDNFVAPAGPNTGYTLIFKDAIDPSKILATSEPFEVKPKNSPYPPEDGSAGAASASGSAAGSASGSATSGSAASSASSAAASDKKSAGVVNAVPALAAAAVACVGAYIAA